MTLLLLLAGHFLMLSLIAMGGASATMPEMHRVLVDSLHLMTSMQFSQMYSIAQAAPGPNILFVALFGWQIAGLSGAIVCLLSMCVPASLLAILVERFGAKHRDRKEFVVIRRGLTPIAIGLLCSTGVILLKSSHHWSSFVISAITLFLLVRFRSINPIWMIIIGAILGIAGLV